VASLSNLVNIQTLKHGWQASREGHKQSTPTGDVRQLGGTFVISRSGIVEFAQVSATLGDDADIPTVLAAHKEWEARNA
jgi:hypothetical protein